MLNLIYLVGRIKCGDFVAMNNANHFKVQKFVPGTDELVIVFPT